MAAIRQILVAVAFCDRQGNVLAHEKVTIPIAPEQEIHVQDLVDACQRSVAHCLDELEKDLDIG